MNFCLDREDFEKYPWDGICDTFFRMYGRSYEALRRNMPQGMKAIGGAGYGIFECVQDLVGYENLCYMRVDDPELYRDMFFQIGRSNLKIRNRLLQEYGDIYCVGRFGDDLGFKSATLIDPQDIRDLVIPQYRPIIQAVHRAGKPFLLHSCGCIFEVMDDIIAAGIDAKHSNEDQIAPFPYWVEQYGSQIGNFGGIDTDAVCRLDEKEMFEYIRDVVSRSVGHGGFASSSLFTPKVEEDGTSLSMTLVSGPETWKAYPFDFRLCVTYTLRENVLEVACHVSNFSDSFMPFALGGHPGFRVPLEPEEAFEDYTLTFTKPCHPDRIGFTPDVYLSNHDVPYPLAGGRSLPLRHDLFDEDAIILKNMDKEITLSSGRHRITVSYPQMSYLGLWHWPKKDAPYVCIEPWTSLPSRAGIVEELTQKSDLINLAPGKTYENIWTVRLD